MNKYNLTNMEYEVLYGLAIGEAQFETAHRMSTGRATVRGYQRTMCTKLGVRDNLEALLKAHKENLVYVDESKVEPYKVFKICGVEFVSVAARTPDKSVNTTRAN